MSKSNLTPGKAGPGRPKGSRNKTTVLAKEAIAVAFDKLGGADGLFKWASASDENRKVFYSQIMPKIIPLQVHGSGEDGEHLHVIERRIVRPDNPNR